ncbi:hypothetical protein HpBGD13_09560 [Helicobacter pylori]
MKKPQFVAEFIQKKTKNALFFGVLVMEARMILKYPPLRNGYDSRYLIRIVWHEQAPVIRIHAQ